MNTLKITTSALLIALITLSSCNQKGSKKEDTSKSNKTTLKNMKKEMGETQDVINSYMYENKEELVAVVNKELKEVDNKIDKLEQNFD
jgi:maltose-binding protein MalE